MPQAGGPQPYSAKNAMLSPAAQSLGFADQIVQAVQDKVAEAKKAQALQDAGQPSDFGDATLSPATNALFGKAPILGQP